MCPYKYCTALSKLPRVPIQYLKVLGSAGALKRCYEPEGGFEIKKKNNRLTNEKMDQCIPTLVEKSIRNGRSTLKGNMWRGSYSTFLKYVSSPQICLCENTCMDRNRVLYHFNTKRIL